MIFRRGWFGPKRIGWGASPASWEGWAVTGGFVLAMLVVGNVFRDATWVWGAMFALVVGFLAIVVLTYDKDARPPL